MTPTWDALIWIPLLPLCGAAINGLLGRRLPRPLVGATGVLASLLPFFIALEAFVELLGRPSGSFLEQDVYTWMAVGGVDIHVKLTFDALSAVMALVVTGVGSLIHFYSLGYMEGDPSYSRYFSYLNLFMFSMLVLVLGSRLGEQRAL